MYVDPTGYVAANQKNDDNRDDVVPEAGGIKNAGTGPVATSGVGVAAGSISADTEPEKKDKKASNNNRSNLTDAQATTHGNYRVEDRGLTQHEYDLLKSSTNIKHQADGATVYIRQITSNNHRVLVENTDGQIITYMKDVTKHGLKNLARNYGWY